MNKVPVFARYEIIWWSGGLIPLILNVCTRWISVTKPN